eukprot:302751-Alexandrium_andersonii.AAC.1
MEPWKIVSSSDLGAGRARRAVLACNLKGGHQQEAQDAWPSNTARPPRNARLQLHCSSTVVGREA